jgi:CheY-like chemotaxis protein
MGTQDDREVDGAILIVEDDPDVQFMLRLAAELLLNERCALKSSVTGVFEEVKETNPPLILLDTSTPGNLQLVKQLKSYPDTRDVPIVGINSRGFTTCVEAIREGYDACFPAGEIDALVARAKEYLARRHRDGSRESPG